MQLGVSLWSLYHEQPPRTWPTLAEAVERILSVDETLGVEVWGSRALEEPTVTGRALVDLVEACRRPGFVTVHVQGRHWHWRPADLRREIGLAHQLGAATLVVHPVCLGLKHPEDRPDWPEIVRLADEAAKFGVRLAVENIFDSIWCLDRILEEIGDDPSRTNVGICIDVGHAAVSHDAGRDSIPNYLERYAGQLVQLHLHDNHGEIDDHLIPGAGDIDWARVFRTLDGLDYSGTAVLEVHRPNVPPLDAVREALDFCREMAS